MACPFLIGKLHKNGEAKLCNVAKRKKDEFFGETLSRNEPLRELIL